MNISRKDRASLRHAKELLEHPGLAARLANMAGVPFEKGLDMLPDSWKHVVQDIARVSLRKALDMAVVTLEEKRIRKSFEGAHKFAVAATGAFGGAFGLPALSIELPISTGLMLRSIADIARNEGEEIRKLESKLACLEVFAMGGRVKEDDAVDTGYFAVRSALARSVSEAAEYIVERGVLEEGAPVIIRLISRIASRFSVVVSEKLMAQAVPFIGAAGGAFINTVFMDHFQDMARGHFIVRRLEREYGAEVVKTQYALV